MWKYITVVLFVLKLVLVSAQHGEEVGPLMMNPALQKDYSEKNNMVKANAGTFDSTFIYLPDTLDLPLFDDFSTNKFQTYNAGYGDPGVTSDKKYRLLDLSDIPLPNTTLYTAQQTFRRTFDIGNGTSTDDDFPATQIKVGDLSSYPVVYSTTDVYPPYYIYDTLDYPNDPDTIWIPDAEIFQDSATQFFAPLNDAELYWMETEAFHNFTMALDPWSLGVVTFDGLDETGYPYAINTSTTNYADHLTSKPIDMTPYNAGDSIYLSFLYQPQGLCDEPESSDSLILEFYAKDLDQWNEVWSVNGGPVTDFQVGHIAIKNADYFTDAFQFRFKNWGGLSGSLDHFHLDYVTLRDLSGYQDTLFKDFAFVYPVNTLLEEFTSVPWDHYVNSVDVNGINRMGTNVNVVLRNGDNVAANNSSGGQCEVFYGGSSEGIFTLPGADLSNQDLNYAPRTTYSSYHDFSTGYQYTTGHTGPFEEFDFLTTASAPFPNFTGNDSTWSKQYFKHYYSYDDGSAELVYGPTGNQARLAIKYTPYEADSLIGAMMHFVPSVTDVSNNLFLLTVWDDNNGQPGNVIYEDDAFFPRTPEYKYKRNVFTTYYFEDTMKIPVSGTFYIGWRQLDPERLGIGLDMNIPNNDKTYFSIDNGNTWQTSGFPGSVMIRPIFSTSFDPYLGIREQKKTEEVMIYPNPATDIVNIVADEDQYTGVEIYNLQGVKMFESNDTQIDLSGYPSGVYLFRLKGSNKIRKIIKN